MDLNLLLFDCNEVIDTLAFLGQACGYEIFYIDEASTHIFRVVFKVLIHLERFEDV